MATVPSLGGLATLDPYKNPVLNGMEQGFGLAQQIRNVPLMRQQAMADIQAKQAIAQMNQQRGGYYDQFGNLKQSQADTLVPAQANRFNSMANVLYPAIAGRQNAQTNTLIPSEAQKNQAQAGYYDKGGSRGATIDYLYQNKNIPPEVAQEAAIAAASEGMSPEVRRKFEYDAAQGDPTLQKNINSANLKASSNQQLLKQQSAMEQMDAAVMPMISDIDNAVSYYSGPSGALKLRGDQIKQASGEGDVSPEYGAYVLALQTQIPLIVDNAAKVLGMQRSDASQAILTMMVGPGEDPSIKTLALMPPQVVRQKLDTVVNYLQRESEVGRNFVAPLSLDPATNQQLDNDLSGIANTMQNQQANAGTPPAGLSKEQYFQWMQQNGGA